MQPDTDQYGFIMNPGTGQPRKSLLPGRGFLNLPRKQLILLVVGAAIVLAILVTIVLSLLGGGPTNEDQLVGVVQRQHELIRVSDIALKEARGTQARNLAMTTKLSLHSDEVSLVAALKRQDVKIGSKQLGAGKDQETDNKLTQAIQNNRFDEVYLEFIQSALADYQRNLNTVYKTTTSTSLKETLKVQYQNASLIIGAEPEE
ncbi:MAG TPA: hypothetical protein VK674_00200 [Candidatus Limnocylindria bacterium]|nr:hypothetical protein [Candidatus Limnocylindria bacterium]